AASTPMAAALRSPGHRASRSSIQTRPPTQPHRRDHRTRAHRHPVSEVKPIESRCRQPVIGTTERPTLGSPSWWVAIDQRHDRVPDLEHVRQLSVVRRPARSALKLSTVHDRRVDALADFLSQMHLAALEESPLYEIPRGSTDLMPAAPGVHGPWPAASCAAVLNIWYAVGWIGLY